jgi:hypothetical protein
MKSYFFTTLFLAGLYATAYSQSTDPVKDTLQNADTVKYFTYGGFASFTLNQVSFSNWSAGGENALSTMALLNIFGNYKKDKTEWVNTLDMGYGFLKNGSSKMRKNEDKIDITSKLGYKAFKNVFYTALINYRSQFADGYNYPNDSVVVSRFNAPAYISVGIGLDYKPYDYFSIYLSPATGRFTIVNDRVLSDSGAFGVDRGKKVRSEFGASLIVMVNKDIFKNVNFTSKLVLFENYTDKDVANRKNIDVLWEPMLNIKAGKYLTTSIMFSLIYDQDVIAKTQIKEVFGIGLSYKL